MIKIFALFCFFLQIMYGYELSICAIFRDEAPYLKEWIEFHKIQGVEHFYLYNHQSRDEYIKVLQPYIDKNQVTLIEWIHSYDPGDTASWLTIQRGAYMDCIERYRYESKWLAVIDIDEFLFCPTAVSLAEFLKPYEPYGALCVNWLLFGTSDIEQIPIGSTMIERLTRCAPRSEPHNAQGKSIVQPRFVKSCQNVHTFLFEEDRWTVDVAGNRVEDGRFLPAVSHDLIRINHYWTRTESHFRNKKIPSRGNRRNEETPLFLQKRARRLNKCLDTSILQFVPLLQERLRASS